MISFDRIQQYGEKNIDTSIPSDRGVLKKYDERIKKYMGQKGQTTNIDWLGAVGERLVIWFLSDIKHFDVIENTNPFDSSGDLKYAENAHSKFHSAEVKTQTPFISQRAFTVRKNQVEKCKAVQKLFIVTPPFMDPKTMNSYSPAIWLNKKTITVREHTTKGGIPMQLMPMEDFSVIHIINIREQIEMLFRYSNNDYRYMPDYANQSLMDYDEHVLNRRYDGYVNTPSLSPDEF